MRTKATAVAQCSANFFCNKVLTGVAVVVEPGRALAVHLGRIQAGPGRDVGEAARAVILEQLVGLAACADGKHKHVEV